MKEPTRAEAIDAMKIVKLWCCSCSCYIKDACPIDPDFNASEPTCNKSTPAGWEINDELPEKPCRF